MGEGGLSKAAFELPASVMAYLSTAAVRSGVDALLAVEADALPDGLEWPELGDYLAARAAAELTRSEWAVMIQRLWREVWASIERDGWRPAPLEEMVENENAVTPETCWKRQRFSVWHTRGRQMLFTAVRATRSTTQIAFSLEARRVLIREDGGEFTWTDTSDWDGWQVATIRCSPASPEFDLEALRTLSQQALRRVSDAV